MPARMFDLARALNWSLWYISCKMSLFIHGNKGLCFTLFLTTGVCRFITLLKIHSQVSSFSLTSSNILRRDHGALSRSATNSLWFRFFQVTVGDLIMWEFSRLNATILMHKIYWVMVTHALSRNYNLHNTGTNWLLQGQINRKCFIRQSMTSSHQSTCAIRW